MAWQTPKTNWAVPDGLTTTDLNRIEENIDYLYGLASPIEISGNIITYIYVPALNGEFIVQKIPILLPSGKYLNLKRVRAYLETPLKLRVKTNPLHDGLDIYTSSQSVIDAEGDEVNGGSFLLYENGNGSILTLEISLFNPTDAPYAETATMGWQLEVVIS